MARRGRSRGSQEADAEAPVPSPPGPFLSLPDIAHYTIACFLPDSYKGRLRLSEVSRALLAHYGGTLTQLSIHRGEGTAARLAALLGRYKKLANVALYHLDALPALCQAIRRRCCQVVLRLRLVGHNTILTQGRLNMLTAALGVDEALAKLVILDVEYTLSPGSLPSLTTVLAGGAAPLLRHFYFNAAESNEEDLESIADMLEARARIPCPGFERIDDIKRRWFDEATLETRIRLLRALLPSIIESPPFTWVPALEAPFIEVKPQYLTRIQVWFGNEWGEADTFSWKVLEAAPALEAVAFYHYYEEDEAVHASGAPILHGMTQALQNVALLQRLEEVELGNWILEDNSLMGFMDALEASGCAKQVVDLTFSGCEFGAEGVRTLADRLRRDAFPDLETLHFSGCPSIADVGVVALAEGLLETTQTSLTNLIMKDVGMSDEGITAVASLVSQGRMEELEKLNIAKNYEVTQQGIRALARALNARGLPRLKYISLQDISGMTFVVTGAIVHLLIKGCPELRRIHLVNATADDNGHRETIKGILMAEDREDDVIVTYKTIGDDDEEHDDDEEDEE